MDSSFASARMEIGLREERTVRFQGLVGEVQWLSLIHDFFFAVPYALGAQTVINPFVTIVYSHA